MQRTLGGLGYWLPAFTPTSFTRGLLWSMLMPPTEAVPMPPLVDETVRVTSWSAPLPFSVTGAGQPVASGDPDGAHTKLTVTVPRYQPALLFFGLPLTDAVIVGSVRLVEAEDARKWASPSYAAATVLGLLRRAAV